jgi:hypothetical protein
VISCDEKNLKESEDIQKMLTRLISNFSRIILIVRWSAIGTQFFHTNNDRIQKQAQFHKTRRFSREESTQQILSTNARL